MTRATRVLIADDHELVRQGIRALIEEQVDLDVVGEAKTGREALEVATSIGPDVVVMDVNLPELDGIEATRRLVSERPDIRVIMLTMFDDATTVDRALRAGARGFVLKGNSSKSLIDALRVVGNGDVYLSSEVSDYVLQGYLGGDGQPADPLTSREREIVRLVAEGLTSREIAEQLGLRPKTVQNHRTRILEKTGAKTTAGLVRYALRHGLAH